MSIPRTRRISKYALAGKTKNISKRIAITRKLRENSLKRASQTSEKIFDNLQSDHIQTKKNKKEYLESIAKQRRQKAVELRKPRLNQKIRRAIIRTNKK